VARILIACVGSHGDINPYIGLAKALKARGHEPLIAASRAREDVEREGLPHAPLRPSGPGPYHHATDWIRASYNDLCGVAQGFDLILTHSLALAGPIVAEKLGLRWVSSVLSPFSFHSLHDTLMSSAAPWLEHLMPWGDEGGAIMVPFARRVTAAWVEPLYSLRSELGLPRGGHPLFEGQHSARRVLGIFPSVLASPQADWPANVRITGPILYNPNADRPLPASIVEFLAAGEPPIVFSLGSSSAYVSRDFYEESASACRMVGRRGIVLVGEAENRPDSLPEGVMVAGHVPHALLFPHAAAVVHPASAGTLNQALYAGKPMVTVPFAFDQPDNARRAVRLGVARTIRGPEYSADVVASELRTLLGDPSYGERAAAVAATVASEDGEAAAARAIESELEAA
jgi:UDP:flavonoid glycosyltransferase YjiC (YdhE family)